MCLYASLYQCGTSYCVLFVYWEYCIHIGVGYLRCSFNNIGQCKSLQVWDEQQEQFPRFLFYVVTRPKTKDFRYGTEPNNKMRSMSTLHIYENDLEIASALINRDEHITRKYFYQQCYPLFKSIFDNYFTDCTCCKEFIDEIYILVLAPSKITGKCQMENYRGESTLARWLKAVCLFYCYKRFERKVSYKFTPIAELTQKKSGATDSLSEKSTSYDIDFMLRSDIESLIMLMPNKRYQKIIKLRYIEHLSNEETAETLGMTMANYYNKHKLAKAQFLSVSRKEAHNG